MSIPNFRVNPASEEVMSERRKSMAKIEEICKTQVQWYQAVSVAEYRRMRAEGIGFPRPARYEGARTVLIQSRGSHKIELRVIEAGKKLCNGVLLHFHAGKLFIKVHHALPHRFIVTSVILLMTMAEKEVL
jgi:hypothetical protein